MSGGLVAVHAHPDDETLSTGALLATWAAAGLPVTLVTCTRGEQGEVIGAEHAALEGDGPALAAHRSRELARATAALGVSDRLFLDEVAGDGPWVDSGMVWDAVGRARAGAQVPAGAFVAVDLELAASRLADVLLDRRPAVVVTYEPDGGYGHPDHVQAHRVTMRGVNLAVERGFAPPCVLWAALDEAALRRGYAACASLAGAEGLLAPDAAGPLPSAAVAGREVDLEVPVSPVLDRVVAAMRAHATQVRVIRVEGEDSPQRPAPADRGSVTTVLGAYALSNDVLQPILPRESYRRVAGGLDAARRPAAVLVR